MPHLLRPCGAKIYYETKGSGIPVLLLAPGGMRSSLAKWESHPYNPWKSLPVSKFQLIGMDQRFANRSTGLPVQEGADGWRTFLADQIALLDHLQIIKKCHLLGSCIGPSYAFRLLRDEPSRFGRCVMLQPIGLTKCTTEQGIRWEGLNTDATWRWVGDWADEILAEEKGQELGPLKQLHERMFGPPRNFVFSVTRQEAAKVQHPLLILMGKDESHPSETSREISRIVPNTELVERWRDEGQETLKAASDKIEKFLEADDLGGLS
jgi:pimeloyl-ACP methyl ester carboxylesterase